MAVVLCPCSLSSALVEDLHLMLSLNALLFLALLALLWTADAGSSKKSADEHLASSHVMYYPLLH